MIEGTRTYGALDTKVFKEENWGLGSAFHFGRGVRGAPSIFLQCGSLDLRICIGSFLS